MDSFSQDNDNPQSPDDDSTCSYKPGSIHRVRLKNFLTYSDVEFRPGPRLNVVIGPNGTGKSTILCAICLGLGGQPPLLGRADDARTFIMHEKDTAEIEIELYPKLDSNETHIIKRKIDRNKGSDRGKGAGASTFYINNVVNSLKNVKALVESYDIAVDNLCTFLPQDRVGSFSGFDAKQLLQETEKSLSGTKHLYQQHQSLIDLEKEILSSGSNLSSVQERLKQIEEDNKRLEREKELMEERKKHEENLELLEQKKAWLEFDLVRLNALELKEERTKIDGTLKDFRATLQPLREQCSELQLQVNKSKSRVKQLEKAIQNSRTGYEKGYRSAELCQDEIDIQLNNFTSIDTMQRQVQQNVKKMEDKVKQVEDELNDYPPENELKQTCNQAAEDMRKLKTQLNRAKHDLSAKSNQRKDKEHMMENLVHKLNRMKDDRARRNERIFRQFPKLYEAHQWLEQNRKMFRRPVWGPVVCEIITKDTDAASFLEQHVANTFLKAFVVECDEDYNLLYRETRQKRNIPTNVIKVPQGKLSEVRRLYSADKMDTLKKEHGVLGYLDEMITVPDAVMEALRNTSSIHQVLVGSSKTQESIDRRNLLDFLSQSGDGRLRGSCVITSHMKKSYKYTTIVSRYSAKTSLRVDEINPAKMLSPGVSPQQKTAVESDIKKVEEELSELLPGVEQATQLYNEITKEGQMVSQRTRDAKKAMEELGSVKSKLKTAMKKLNDAQKEAQRDFAAEKQGILTKLKNHTTKYISSLENASNQNSQLMENTSKYATIKMSEDGLLHSLQKVTENLAERESETSHLEAKLKDISLKFKDAKNKMKQLKQYADKIAPIKDADGNELPLRAKLAELPEHISEIEALIEDATTKIQSIHDNPEALRRYEEQKIEIEKIRKELDGLHDAEGARRDQLKNLREPWENALINMVEKVNLKFSAYMKELKYAGEIILSRGDDVDGNHGRSSRGNNAENLGNFKDWGIKIRVKFRGKSDLQTLSAQVHSGGERSVSTIMYLMALQDLMVSPFRCVDEINQGLDERNERFVFKRIVLNSTSSKKDENTSNHSGQYFLITPKLLPNLTDMEHPDVTILCIFNGPYNFSHFNDWDVNSFLNGKKRSRNGENAKIQSLNGRKRVKDE